MAELVKNCSFKTWILRCYLEMKIFCLGIFQPGERLQALWIICTRQRERERESENKLLVAFDTITHWSVCFKKNPLLYDLKI